VKAVRAWITTVANGSDKSPETADIDAGIELWSSASWRALATAWLDEQLSAAGIHRIGEIEQPHLRPWATALRAATSAGVVWLKAAGPGTRFEVGLYEVLERVAPGHVLEPIAIDLARGWLLLPDGGVALGEQASGGALIDAMTDVLPQYAELQRRVIPHVETLLVLGITDMRAHVMPQRFEEALDLVGARAGSHTERGTLQRVSGLRATFASWCGRLADMPGEASLDHNDLHPWNVFVEEGQSRRARFYDWGDSVVAHPFSSMLVALGYLHTQVGIPIESPELTRLRDAYLDGFRDLAPHRELVETLELACRVGKVARALTWERALRAQADDAPSNFAAAPIETLASLLEESYLGGA
jgi:Phosphotransferase enzyme family